VTKVAQLGVSLFSFGSRAVSERPLALRPSLAVGLPFRVNGVSAGAVCALTGATLAPGSNSTLSYGSDAEILKGFP